MDRPALTLRQAADACSVHLSTIRRRHAAEAFPNAFRRGDGAWLIPVTDLQAAGLRVNAPAPPDPSPTTSEVSDPVSEQLAQALAELAQERARRALAEQKAELLERHLGDVQTLMRALTAAPPSEPERAHDHALSDSHDRAADQAVSVPPARRRWAPWPSRRER
ncbi:hypothetical protein ACGFLS_32410 [Streptomyces abikoensis]|uniref:hypothetical protein n=1 Tax=Streptomyces abikoensis TaxID=97398 RepID=UPI00371BB319